MSFNIDGLIENIHPEYSVRSQYDIQVAQRCVVSFPRIMKTQSADTRVPFLAPVLSQGCAYLIFAPVQNIFI